MVCPRREGPGRVGPTAGALGATSHWKGGVPLVPTLPFCFLLIFGMFLPWTDGPRGGVEGWPRRGLCAPRQSQGQSQLLFEIQLGGPRPALSAQYKHPRLGDSERAVCLTQSPSQAAVLHFLLALLKLIFYLHYKN